MSGTGGSSGSGELEPDERVGTVLAGRYRLDALLGEGGMGRVYSGEHVLMRKRLAVKVLHRELTSVPEVVARFEREAMAAANIEHPNVAAATDFGKLEDGAVYLVLEFVQGKNLRDEIAQGPMPLERALHIVRQIAAALGAAHALDIVHRDLKPENVMLIEKGGDPDFVKVLDFGIAKVPIAERGTDSGPITKVGMVFGTPEYMAPEQALGQGVDGRADLYALGVILYETIAGVRPFSSKSPVGILGQQLARPAPAFGERVPGLIVPPQVEAIALQLLAKDLPKRFQSAAEVIAALDELMTPIAARGVRRFTQQAGSPASVVQPRIASIPDLEPPKLDELTASSGDEALPFVTAIPVDQPRPSLEEMSLSAILVPDEARQPTLAHGSPELAEAAIPSAPLPPVEVAPPQRREVVERVRSEAAAFLRRAYALIDEQRARLPPKVQEPLRDVPTPGLFWTLVGALLAVLTAAIVLVVTLATREARIEAPVASADPSAGASAPQVPSAPPPLTGVQKQIAEAKPKGSAALMVLLDEHPKDADVMLALAEAYADESKYADAVAFVAKLLEQDPARFKEPRVASVLKTSAQSKSAANAAFVLLEGPMGPFGADVIYELATDEQVKLETRMRAERSLKSKRFEQIASAPLWAAVLLRNAKGCQQRYGLLLRAKNVGDRRALEYLKKFEKTTQCSADQSKDCNACLLADDRLAEAIKAIEKRVGGS